MSPQTQVIRPIPRETARVAKAVFGGANFYILLGEHLGTILDDIRLERLSGVDALIPLVTIFQALEGLTDLQAVDAVRTRIDWKFALHLDVNGPVVPRSVFCEFRRKVQNETPARNQFDRLVNRVFTIIPAPVHEANNPKGADLLLIVCSLNQLSLILDAMQQAIEILAVRFPSWLQKIALPHWYGRYSSTAPEFVSIAALSRSELSAAEISEDINRLLDEIHRSGPPEVQKLPEIKALHRMGRQQFGKKYQSTENPVGGLNSTDCDHCIYAPGGNLKTIM